MRRKVMAKVSVAGVFSNGIVTIGILFNPGTRNEHEHIYQCRCGDTVDIALAYYDPEDVLDFVDRSNAESNELMQRLAAGPVA